MPNPVLKHLVIPEGLFWKMLLDRIIPTKSGSKKRTGLQAEWNKISPMEKYIKAQGSALCSQEQLIKFPEGE